MKKQFYNKEQIEREKKEKERARKENEIRKNFFATLKRNKKFQKYVVEEIINRNINSLTNTQNLMTKERTKEELADLVIANLKAAETLKNIFKDII